MRRAAMRASLVLNDNGVPQPQQTHIDFTVVVSGKANSAPDAVAGADITATVGEEIDFYASASADPDGSILAYEWDFDDGNLASGMETRHIYQFPGRYVVTLKVTDDEIEALRLSDHDSLTVRVNAAENSPPMALVGVLGDDWTVMRSEIVSVRWQPVFRSGRQYSGLCLGFRRRRPVTRR